MPTPNITPRSAAISLARVTTARSLLSTPCARLISSGFQYFGTLARTIPSTRLGDAGGIPPRNSFAACPAPCVCRVDRIFPSAASRSSVVIPSRMRPKVCQAIIGSESAIELSRAAHAAERTFCCATSVCSGVHPARVPWSATVWSISLRFDSNSGSSMNFVAESLIARSTLAFACSSK